MEMSSIAPAHRMLLANKPRLLREMLERVLAKVYDLEIAGQAINLAELLLLVEQMEPHWVIVSLTDSGSIPGTVKSLLNRYPTVYILGIALDGSQVLVNQIGFPEDVALANLSLEELINILRSR